MATDLISPPIPSRVSPSDFIAPSDPTHLSTDDILFRALCGLPCYVLPDAQAIVASVATDAEQALAASETGKRLETLRTRLAATTARVQQVSAQHSDAERSHFEALAGPDDAAVAESRARVLELHSQLSVLTDERDQLRRLLSDAENAALAERKNATEVARAATVAKCLAERNAAFERLKAIVTSDQFKADLRQFATAALVMSAIPSAGHYRHNCQSFVSNGVFRA